MKKILLCSLLYLFTMGQHLNAQCDTAAILTIFKKQLKLADSEFGKKPYVLLSETDYLKYRKGKRDRGSDFDTVFQRRQCDSNFKWTADYVTSKHAILNPDSFALSQYPSCFISKPIFSKKRRTSVVIMAERYGDQRYIVYEYYYRRGLINRSKWHFKASFRRVSWSCCYCW